MSRDRRLIVLAVVALVALVMPALGPPAAAAQDSVDWGDLDHTGLIDLGAVDDDTPMTFLFGLAADRAGRNAFALAVNSPRNPSYGEHLPLAEVVEHFGAPASVSDAVLGVLRSAGHEGELDPTRTYVEASMTAAEAETLFSVEWRAYAYPESSQWEGAILAMPTTTPTLPEAMQGNVERVHGAVLQLLVDEDDDDDGDDDDGGGSEVESLGAPGVAASTSPVAGGTPVVTGTPSGCAAGSGIVGSGYHFGLTPSQVLAAYGVDDLHSMGLRGQGQKVAIVDETRMDPGWLETFKECFGISGATPVTQHVVGDPDSSAADETILDASVMTAVAPALERLDIYVVGSEESDQTEDDSLDLMRMFEVPLDAVLAGAPAPDVVSASFGLCEAAPTFWNRRSAIVGITEDILAASAAAGIAWVVSTGDSGASGCQANFVTPDYEVKARSVEYPGSSAWVTAVGGTNLTLDAENDIASSGVWNDTEYPSPFGSLPYGGTGGVSELVTRPSWQDSVSSVAGGARAVPDVSLFADRFPGYAIFGPGGWEAVGGTSAAAPLFAGILALLGQQAEVSGQPGIGFASPLLYELGTTGSDALMDITLGDNDVHDIGCCAATVGYDLASGWGSVRAATLASELAAPTVSLGATRSFSGDTVTLSATVDAPGGTVLTYDWDLDSDGVADEVTTTPELTAAWVAGRTVSVTANTSLGRSGSASTHMAGGSPATPAPITIAG
ncbi:MAG: S53 family serine peptidase [Microthrixaceae bacterium]|nr:S53 family serine peptidase [Microthrixaceae bacterium]